MRNPALIVRRILLLASAFLFGGCQSVRNADLESKATYGINESGYGPIQIGMSKAEMNQATSWEFLSDNGIGEPAHCHHLKSKEGPPGLLFMMLDGRLSRTAIYQPPSPIRTTRGVGLGMTVDDIKRAYGSALAEGSDAGGGATLTWWATEDRGVRFDIDTEGKITGLYAGDSSINLSEGCA